MEIQNSRLSILGVVPARGGSKGVPNKNITDLGGKPLISHTLDVAQRVKGLDRVLVSTDSEQIAQVARDAGAEIPYLRAAALSTDTARVQDAVFELIEKLDLATSYDYLMLLQPTTPFRTEQDIEAAMALAEKHRPDAVVSFTQEETHHPYYMYHYEADSTSQAATVSPFFSYRPGTPRQEFPSAVYRNGAIYLVRMSYFLEHRSFLPQNVVPYLMPWDRSINIDTPEDVDFATYLLSKRVSR